MYKTDIISQYLTDIYRIFPGRLTLSPKELGQLRKKSIQTLRRERERGVGVEFIEGNGRIEYPIRSIAEWLAGQSVKTA